ncbi:hypothetical protein EYF80_047020 [Liparis tanakae]|uniref:Uncharacterized protein n=1 Tax=Liparis tanakae TaxID=230148 RepID=A0A4Z2FPU8_9TELE|nr:hypothetical protein EYF80_047020 [Liparis tanakae]
MAMCEWFVAGQGAPEDSLVLQTKVAVVLLPPMDVPSFQTSHYGTIQALHPRINIAFSHLCYRLQGSPESLFPMERTINRFLKSNL